MTQGKLSHGALTAAAGQVVADYALGAAAGDDAATTAFEPEALLAMMLAQLGSPARPFGS